MGVRWKKQKGARGVCGGEAGYDREDGYRRIRIKDKEWYVHRVAWYLAYGVWPERDLDHINRDPRDNRPCNLRIATRSGNRYNSKNQRNNTSGYRGVSWKKETKKWQVSVQMNGRRKHLGYFEGLEEAARVFDEHLKQVAGEFYPD